MKITVIGGGPGGYEAAIYAAKKGAEVVLIEKDKVGGTCLNRGCIPTKAFLASYDAYEAVEKAKDFGLLDVNEPKVDYPAILARKNKVMSSLVKGIEFLCNQNKVTLINGMGEIKDKNTIEVTKSDGSKETVTTDYIILATGSVPVCPPVFKVDRKRVVTSDEILDFEQAPKSLILVGGGVIGCEIGQFLAKMGTQVTVVEALPRLMATMDEDVSKQISRQFKKEKIKMVTGDGIAEVNPADDHVDVKLSSGKELSAEYVLVAIGRAPFTAGAGLENVGVEMAERGRVKVNEYLQTNVDNIYAIGDIIPSAQLAHVASKEGIVAVDNIFGAKKVMTYHAVPGCVFTNPQLASVGKLEWQLEKEGKEAGKDFKTGKFEFKGLGKAQASGHIAGFVKVIVDADDVLIGAEIVGAGASDMLQVLTTAIQLKLTAKEVGDSIFPHPTMCEAIMEALHDVHGLSVHKA
ncbi:dihydrolipoamide dehydrogenase [Acetitomaculum ruminis DSM 5522]|uniref:Dihydrolipoyl dehydrogenase n=1 Tax=Acetitomaculum ruminis DSM 5522 TaxID=1120918 RepID=A0A1I0UZ91_9FIRM|nr:dihydrolipoyl dehydrogenase [Acetitomaculum ruminis]SFA69358.1 dihydrolipoamide dehydrogenase [Acetitomaculum ruminis DSM 5522]